MAHGGFGSDRAATELGCDVTAESGPRALRAAPTVDGMTAAEVPGVLDTRELRSALSSSHSPESLISQQHSADMAERQTQHLIL